MATDNTVNVEITASVDGLSKGLKKADSSIKGFGTSTDKVTSKTNKMANSVKINAVPAMTSFSQVVQDAPYGIRGVANNIQQLTSQFGYLSAKTGGAKGAIKAMLSSLAGPAGMLFAVSAVTSLLVSYGDELFKSSKEVDNSTVANEKLNDALRQQLNLRKLLKDELSIAANIAKAEAKLAGKSEEEQYLEGKKWSEARIAVLKGELVSATKLWKESSDSAVLAKNQENEEIQQTAKDAYKNLIDLQKTYNDAKSQLYLDDLNEQIRINEKNKQANKSFQGEIVSNLETFKSTITPIVNETSQTLANVIPPVKSISDKMAGWLLALQGFSKESKNLIQGSITSTFANLGNAIGEAMANGQNVFSAAGNAILSGIGSFLSDLGSLMIKYGVAALAYSTATKALLNPLTAAPAAVTLIAAGTVLSVLGGAISATASGSDSSYSGSTDYSSSGSNSNYGSSTSYSGSSGSGGGTYVFEIAGTKLIGVLKNTLNRNKSLGGSTNLVFG